MARSQAKAAPASSNDDRVPIVPIVAIEDEVLSAEERRNLAQASRDRTAGRFFPLGEAFDVARR
jgi:hypothetical protein